MDIFSRISSWVSVFFKKNLGLIIFFITSRCNSRCISCFYWKKINKNPDIRREKIERISKKLGKFKNLLLSGGEPFLRDDLVKVIGIFVRNNDIKIVSIPSNGLLTEKIIGTTKAILYKFPQVSVSINISIDGLEETNNRIRQPETAFKKAIKTIKGLNKLKRHFENLQVLVNTVVCHDNYKEIKDLALYLQRESNIDGHFFELVRGHPKNREILEIPPQELKRVYEGVFPIQLAYFKGGIDRKIKKGLIGSMRRLIREEEFIGSLIYQYNTQFNKYTFGKKWSVPCLAGRLIKVVDSNGEIYDCELRSKAIKDCSCTHVCFINISSLFNWKSYFIEFPFFFLRFKLLNRVL